MRQFIEGGNKPVIFRYRPTDLSPFAITKHTAKLLDEIGQGIIAGCDAKEYFYEVTADSYLARAKTGSRILFPNDTLGEDNIDPLTQEATRHAFVIFAWMHEVTKWKFIPTGFSRRGMLAAPTTQKQFDSRIDQLAGQLKVVSIAQEIREGKFLATLPSLRLLSFFQTASILPFHLPEPERYAGLEREQLKNIATTTMKRINADARRLLANIDL